MQSRRPSAQSAMASSTSGRPRSSAALRDAGAREEDLRTTGLNLWFDQSATGTSGVLRLNVGIPADDVGRFIDAAAEVAGDEFTLNGVSFSVADPAPVVAPLRELAVADARAKAEVLAGAGGCTVGTIVTIVEGGGGGAVPVFKGVAREAMAAPIEAGTRVALASR